MTRPPASSRRRFSPGRPGGVGVILAVLATLPFGLPAPLAGQDGAPERVLHEARPGTTGVAISLNLPMGSAHDPPGGEGSAFLLGRVLQEWGEERLGALSGRIHLEVGLESTLLTVQTPASTWNAAWGELREMLTTAPIPERLVAAARDRLADELAFQAGAPVRDFEARWRIHRLDGLLGSGGRTNHPPQGTAQGIRALDAGALEAFRRQALDWGAVVAAVVGSASPGEVAALQGRRLSTVRTLPADTARAPAPGPADSAAVPGAGAPPPLPGDAAGAGRPAEPDTTPLPAAWREVAFPAGGGATVPSAAGDGWRPWVARDRVLVDEEVTSTWIGVAWALPPGASWTLKDFLAHVVRESLNPSPPDPGLYRADVRLEGAGEHVLLVVTATVDPQSAVAWEARILETLQGVATEPPPGAFFELTRRRYRSGHLLEMADPALRARWLAQQGIGDRTPPRVVPDSWTLSREALGALAASRGEPRILVYGPTRMMATPGS